MEGSWRSSGKRAGTTYVAVAFGVAVVVATVVLAVVLPVMLCQPGSAVAGGSVAGLEKALAVTNRSLAEVRGQWDECRKELGVLEGKVSELEQALTKVTQLQAENGELKAEVAQQQEQLKDLQSSRDELQRQNQLLEDQLWDLRNQRSGGSGVPAVSLSLLALLLPGGLLL